VDSSFEIALASESDATDVLALIAQLYADEAIVFRPEPMADALRKLLADSALGFVLVARDRSSRAIAGYGVATLGFDVEFAGHDAFITDLYVEEPARKRGLGRALLDAMIEALAARGVKAVHLMVRPENERARALYETLGFRAVPRILMTKNL
jgi:ribosomal protein S18 acetylase RimI-like enzyme